MHSFAYPLSPTPQVAGCGFLSKGLRDPVRDLQGSRRTLELGRDGAAGAAASSLELAQRVPDLVNFAVDLVEALRACLDALPASVAQVWCGVCVCGGGGRGGERGVRRLVKSQCPVHAPVKEA
jgi:hypothetical protein